MDKRGLLRPLCLLLAGALLAHCGPEKLAGGSGAGNPPLAEVSLAFKANSLSDTQAPAGSPPASAKSSAAVIRNADGTFTVRDSSGAALVLASIDVQVGSIEFDLPDGLDCGKAPGTDCDNGEVFLKGRFAMDLMTGKSTPDLEKIRLPEGLYKTVGLQLDGTGKEDSGGQPNMVIRGMTDSAQGPIRRFALKLRLPDGLGFEKPDGFRITAATVNTVVIRLAVDNWLHGVDLAACLDTTAVVPDASGIRNLEGDGFCNGAGMRVRRNIEASGEIENEAGENPP